MDAAALRAGVREAYQGGAAAWSGAPARIYRRMADALVASCPRSLVDARVLDFGAGTGATSGAFVDAGARVIAVDLSPAMLSVDRKSRPPATTGDAYALPIRAAAFDLAAGGFVLSHLPEPVRAVREVARCVRPDGVVMTLGFDGRWEFEAKDLIESALVAAGYRRPAWFAEFKASIEPRAALPDRLAAIGRDSGLADVHVSEHAIDTGVRVADDIIAWRFGSPGYSTFVGSLDDARLRRIVDGLRDALGPDPEPLVPEVLVMSGRVAR